MRPTARAFATVAVLMLVATACGSDRATSESSLPGDSSPNSSAIETTSTTTARPTTTSSVADTGDPADVYLGATTEIYRRRLPDGHDFLVRLSSGTYATVFGFTWTAPTGSADMCLGDHAVFLGVPGDIGFWGSAWVAAPWFDDPKATRPVELHWSMTAAENTVPPTQYVVVRAGTEAAEIVLAASDGIELDRAPVSNSIAMLIVGPGALGEDETWNDLTVAVVDLAGQRSAPVPLDQSMRTPPTDCGPGDAPQRPLPPSGAQPANPDSAEAQIRQRHALLVDRSAATAQKLADLLDDDTGVHAAIAALDAGPYRDIAAESTYSVDELVFTQPNEAWFRYTITTPSSTYTDRIGIAVLNGTVWQITRATICQDLAFAQAPCDPDPPTVEPPPNPQWDAAWQEWVGRAMLYTGNDGCPQLSQC